MKDLSHLDASWTNVDPCIWSIVENGVGELTQGSQKQACEAY